MNTRVQVPDKLLRIRQVLGQEIKNDDGSIVVVTPAIIPVSKTAWYAGIAEGIYPEPVRLGRSSAWRESDVMAVVAGTYQRRGAGA